jgi:hypothetical protein
MTGVQEAQHRSIVHLFSSASATYEFYKCMVGLKRNIKSSGCIKLDEITIFFRNNRFNFTLSISNN